MLVSMNKRKLSGDQELKLFKNFNQKKQVMLNCWLVIRLAKIYQEYLQIAFIYLIMNSQRRLSNQKKRAKKKMKMMTQELLRFLRKLITSKLHQKMLHLKKVKITNSRLLLLNQLNQQEIQLTLEDRKLTQNIWKNKS